MELSKTNHVLLFPFPAKGHIKPFLCLAQLLANAGLTVTLLNTDRNHREIHNRDRVATEFPSIHFDSIPDGLPPDEPVNVLDGKLFVSMPQVTKALFRELLVSARPPVTCLITDVIFRFPIDVAEELGVPVFSFCTFSARFLSLYFSIPNLLQDGQIPHAVGKKEEELHCVPGSEGLLRFKDLPGPWSVEDVKNYDPMNFVSQTLDSSRTSGLIINTFDELEAPFLTNLSKIYNKIYTIGPIHSLLKNSHCGLWKEDHSCLAWLDSQPSRSVIFASFGSLVKITSSQLSAVWNGLVNSGKSFLLVLRSDVIEGEDEKKVVREIMDTKAKGRWLIVSWAPQEEVLAHEAIGGFLTHSGWNSTLESVSAGVPMISCPQIGDQPSNCTWVSKVWKIGLSMEDGYDESTVEAMVRSMMEQEGEEMNERIIELAKQVKDRVGKDGTSSRNFESLVEDIKIREKLT